MSVRGSKLGSEFAAKVKITNRGPRRRRAAQISPPVEADAIGTFPIRWGLGGPYGIDSIR